MPQVGDTASRTRRVRAEDIAVLDGTALVCTEPL
jgi:hypothetical protein